MSSSFKSNDLNEVSLVRRVHVVEIIHWLDAADRTVIP